VLVMESDVDKAKGCCLVCIDVGGTRDEVGAVRKGVWEALTQRLDHTV
jgi:hypothetical protein